MADPPAAPRLVTEITALRNEVAALQTTILALLGAYEDMAGSVESLAQKARPTKAEAAQPSPVEQLLNRILEAMTAQIQEISALRSSFRHLAISVAKDHAGRVPTDPPEGDTPEE